jgi:hypothetical protein
MTLSATVALGASSTAHAATAVGDDQVDQWVSVAKSYWGQSLHCPTGLRLTRDTHNPDPRVWATADISTCVLALDPDFYPQPASLPLDFWQAGMCHVVVHEYGHLLGHPHAAEGIMKPAVPVNGIRGCPQYDNATNAYFAGPAVPPPAEPSVNAAARRKRAKRKPCRRYKYGRGVSSRKRTGKKHRKRRCRVYRVR